MFREFFKPKTLAAPAQERFIPNLSENELAIARTIANLLSKMTSVPEGSRDDPELRQQLRDLYASGATPEEIDTELKRIHHDNFFFYSMCRILNPSLSTGGAPTPTHKDGRGSGDIGFDEAAAVGYVAINIASQPDHSSGSGSSGSGGGDDGGGGSSE